MRNFHDPAPCLLDAVGLPFFILFLVTGAHMRLITTIPYLSLSGRADISGIGTQMLPNLIFVRAFNHDCIKRGLHELHVVGVGAA